MAKVTIYLPDEIERELKQKAKDSSRSLSSLITELALSQLRPRKWPDGFRDLYGAWQGSFPEIEDDLPQEIEELE